MWHYTIVIPDSPTFPDTYAALTSAGEQGWELVAVHPLWSGAPVAYFFKRQS